MTVLLRLMCSSSPFFLFFPSKNDRSIMDVKRKKKKGRPVKQRKEILSYFTLELFRIYAEKILDLYKTQVPCAPTKEKS